MTHPRSDADTDALLSRVSKAADGTDTAEKDMILCQVESVLMGDPLARREEIAPSAEQQMLEKQFAGRTSPKGSSVEDHTFAESSPSAEPVAWTPFHEKRGYDFRKTRATRAAVASLIGLDPATPTPLYASPVSDASRGREWSLAIHEAARTVEVHAQEMRNLNISISADGLTAIGKAILTLANSFDNSGEPGK